jgi:hypothetical protein
LDLSDVLFQPGLDMEAGHEQIVLRGNHPFLDRQAKSSRRSARRRRNSKAYADGRLNVLSTK